MRPIDLVGSFIEEQGWIAIVADGRIDVSTGLAHVATIEFDELNITCYAPGPNRPEWNIDLHDPNSFPNLISVLKYLDDRCVYTLSFGDESDEQQSLYS
jgi:hypothetical protein